jgi:hypothetical protein
MIGLVGCTQQSSSPPVDGDDQPGDQQEAPDTQPEQQDGEMPVDEDQQPDEEQQDEFDPNAFEDPEVEELMSLLEELLAEE